MSLSVDDVQLAFRMILGRPPKDEVVAQTYARNMASLEELRAELMRSSEFAEIFSKVALGSATRRKLFARLPHRDVDVDAVMLKAMFSRIRQQWEELGEEEPHWSVLTADQFRAERISDNLQAFYASGKSDAGLVDAFAARAGEREVGGTCFELGCGVGRITRYLCQRFDHVIAADISAGNLKICKEHLASLGIDSSRVTFMKVDSADDFLNLPDFDYFYSLIVFQHNPPPIQQYMLSHILSRLSDEGACLFHMHTHDEKYEFLASEYLESRVPRMEMHTIPMSVVFNLLAKNGLACREVLQDKSLGQSASHFFYAEKPVAS